MQTKVGHFFSMLFSLTCLGVVYEGHSNPCDYSPTLGLSPNIQQVCGVHCNPISGMFFFSCTSLTMNIKYQKD